MDAKQLAVIEHMEFLHRAMGIAIATSDFVGLLENTGDMELLAGKAAHDARVSAAVELQLEHDRSRCACDRVE